METAKKNDLGLIIAKVIYYMVLILLFLLIAIAISTHIFLPTTATDQVGTDVNYVENTK